MAFVISEENNVNELLIQILQLVIDWLRGPRPVPAEPFPVPEVPGIEIPAM